MAEFSLKTIWQSISKFVFTVVAMIIFVFGVYMFKVELDKSKVEYKKEQESTCPSLLSIARSSRDTLIVMKNKSMCTEYMLNNLK